MMERDNPFVAEYAKRSGDAETLGGHPASYFAPVAELGKDIFLPLRIDMSGQGYKSNHLLSLQAYWDKIPNTCAFAGELKDDNRSGIFGYKANKDYGGCVCISYNHLYFFGLHEGAWTQTTLV